MTETLDVPTDPDLAAFRAQVDRVADDARALLERLSTAQASWSPPSGGWSVAQCVDHLNIIGDLYLDAMEERIADARARGITGRGRPGPGWLGRMLIRSMDAPPGRRMRAPSPIVPGREPDAEATRTRFFALQVRIAAALSSADGLMLRRVRITSPLLSLLRMNLCTAFGVVIAHERRHLWQAREVTRLPDFPDR
jgi:hypothetical protein